MWRRLAAKAVAEDGNLAKVDRGFFFFPLQGDETQKQSSHGSRAAPHQSDSHSAAAKSTDSVPKHACSGNEMSSASTDTLGTGAGVTPHSQNDHETGQCVRNCHTASVVGTTTGSGHPANLTLNLAHYNNEEKQDQSKDEPLLELRPQEDCDCKCKLVLWWSVTFHFWGGLQLTQQWLDEGAE